MRQKQWCGHKPSNAGSIRSWRSWDTDFTLELWEWAQPCQPSDFRPVKLTLDFWAPECERIRFCGSKPPDLWQFVTEATGKKSDWLFQTAFLGLKQRKFLLASKKAAHGMFTRAPRIGRVKETDLSIWSEVPWCIVTSTQWNDRTLAAGFLLIIYTLGTRDCAIFTHLSTFTKT